MKKWIFAAMALMALIAMFAMVGCSTEHDDDDDGISVSVSGAASVAQGGNTTFTANVKGTNNKEVTWEVTGGTGSGTVIDTTGKLTVDVNEGTANNKLTVTAISVADTSKKGTKKVSVTAKSGGGDDLISIKFYSHEGGDLLKTIEIPPEVSIDNANKTLAKKPNRGPDFMFKGWEASIGGEPQEVTVDTSFFADTNVYGTYYDGVFHGNTTGAEKVYLENATLAVYEFDLGGTSADAIAKIKAIKGIKASYGASEAAMQSQTRLRVYGPYFFNNSPTTLTAVSAGNAVGSVFFGDFKTDRNGKLVARHEGGASLPETFNKFQSYLLNGAGDTNVTGPKDTWFDVEYDLSAEDDGTSVLGSGYSYQKTLRFLGDNFFTDGTVSDTQVVPPTTDFSKIYFAIGLWRGNAGQVVNTTDSIWDHGRVFLVKDIKLILGDDSEVSGTPPSLSVPAHTQAINATLSEEIAAIADTRQVFSGYIDPVVGSWRGEPNETVDPSNAPGWTAPVKQPDAPEHFVIDLAADPSLVKLYGNTDENRLSKAEDGTISVNLTADAQGWGAGITFDIPNDWLEYTWEGIIIEYDADIDTEVSGTRAQFAAKGGRGTWNPNLAVGSGSSNNAWPSVQNNEGQRFTIAGDANLGTEDELGISFQLNANSATDNLPQKYTIKFTRIVLRAP